MYLFRRQRLAHYFICFVILTVVGLFGEGIAAAAEPPAQSPQGQNLEEAFAEYVIQLRQLIEEKKYLEAKQQMNELADLFTHLSFENKTDVEGVEALSRVILNLKYALTRLTPEHEELLHLSLQLYLATDALFHEEQPLWKNTYSQFQTILFSLRETKIAEESMAEWRDLNELYQDIRPALFVDTSPIYVNQLDSIIQDLQRLATAVQIDEKAWQDRLVHLEQLMKEVFWGEEEMAIAAQMQTSFTKLLFAFAAILFLALGYFSFRSREYGTS